MVQKGLLMKGHFCAHLYALSLFVITLLFPIKTIAIGFTPTDGGLVVNLESGRQILLSVMVDDDNNPSTPDVEYFVCHYPGYTGGHFKYYNWDDNESGNILKLVPQDAGATEPASPSIWTIDNPKPFLKSGTSYPFDGIGYTMWSTNPGGDSYTLVCSPNSEFKYQGYLTRDQNHANICNAIFVVPTDRGDKVKTFDPNNTMGRGTKFNGEKGYGFLDMPYREVYWLDIPRGNKNPMAYTNASVVSFNTTTSDYKYSSNAETAKPGQAMYAFADGKHQPTKRTIFRLYVLDEPVTSTCADSYFFAYDEQDYVRYKEWDKNNYTSWRKIYTIDRLVCMERLGDTKYYVSDYMNVPESDSTYYYVGYQNKYCHTDRGDAFNSQFDSIQTLKIHYLGLPAPRGAYGQMIVDTTQTGKQNLGVEFQPGGYFLRTNTDRNIRLIPSADGTTWTCEEMWHITDAYSRLEIRATMFTGSEYSDDDPGAYIEGWSSPVVGTSVPLADGSGYVTGNMDGWARIHVNSQDPNGHLEFILANSSRHIHYDNNSFVGEQLPDHYPMQNENFVTVREPRLVKGFEFYGWALNPEGTGTLYLPGETITLEPGTTTLYAIAEYTGTIHVALSFKKADGKRYFLTHPGSAAPRFSRARYIAEWTNAWQGMANADNVDDNYLNTFKVLTYPNPCEKCSVNEVVLDPRREMRYGAVDSLLFYENFAPDDEEYLGLYYTDPNVVLANDTWAGLFKSSASGGRNGWPDYTVADVQNAKLSSTHYLTRVDGDITRVERPNNDDGTFIKYNATDNQFDAELSEAEATTFQISRVRVADEHYVVIPDTTTEWVDEIVFGIHNDEQIEHDVWSKLIGKQLMAMTKLDDEIVYFHPNPNKIITDYTQLRLNANYRLEESFEYIRDARVESLGTVDDEDKPHMSDRLDKSYFGRRITSGVNTPVDVKYNDEYIDIVDTLRITLRTRGPVKIKEYYGRWKEGASGLHIRPDGSRYRDILVRTKTVHHGPEETKLVLTPEYPTYNFSPLADASKQLNFTLAKVKSRKLHDTDGNVLEEEILSSEVVTSALRLGPGACSFTSGNPSAYFTVNADQTSTDHVTLVTKSDNASGVRYDTLVINNLTAEVDGISYPVSGRVPLMQAALANAELVWSAVANGVRYFIMAGIDGLIFRQYELKGGILYKKEDGKTQLVKGSANAANDQTEYITPWKYTYVNKSLQQLSLETEYGVGKKFIVSGDTPGVGDGTPVTLTYEYVKTNVDNDANYEEQVRIRYGDPETGKWLKLDATPALTLTTNSNEATVFYWTYLKAEYSLREQDGYPSVDQLVFGYNSTSSASVRACYKARHQYAMLLDSVITYCSEYNTFNLKDLTNPSGEWKTNKSITIIPDARPGVPSSGLSITGTTNDRQITTIQPSGDSPTEVRSPAGTGPFVNIVDTLCMQYSLQPDAPDYVFRSTWTDFKSIEEANLKIPLIRRTYHSAPYDSLICTVENDEHYFVFPPEVSTGVNDEHTFTLHTDHHWGTNILDVDGKVVSYSGEGDDHTGDMHLDDPAYADIRLSDEKGNRPDWCEISNIGTNTITVRCKGNGIRSPRSAELLLAYTMKVNNKWRFINFRIQVMQSSRFQYGNQSLVHSKGASGDDLKDGVQQVHENRNILYYYNPSNTAQSEDQRVELPLRERNFYGWWRWYSLQKGAEDSDIPAERWQTPPTNTGNWDFPFRIIGGKVLNPKAGQEGEPDSIVVTQGRYTVFHVPSQDYNARKDPPSKAPMLYPPQNKAIDTFAVDLSVYYDNLPLSMKNINQVDTAALDTMQNISEPTLSLREIYELHPWTERADTLDHYKYALDAPYAGQKYLEDHVVRAPIGNRLLLTTEQRYNYEHLKTGQHSESLLGYYMHDDNWESMSSDPDPVTGITRQDTMIWCGGWDVDCLWYTYNPTSGTYAPCSLKVTEANDFLNVPAKTSMPSNQDADTVIYCLRARSWKSPVTPPTPPETEKPVEGDYWFNICRYTIIYHRTDKYGPKVENNNGVSIITNDDIEQNFEVLERLNFDYNKPGTDYTVYPHPLPWGDASYGFAYPKTAALPDNRPHNKIGLENLANMGEYNLINRIPDFGSYWYKMEQHGGAANGYMIFCDGMSSAGQVAALTLESHLCEGQKMYFSGYVANPGSQSGDKSCPNFLFAVQGSMDGNVWEDITSYLTGDIPQSDKWYQIFFPIEQDKDYNHFRVRVFNMASNDDGNDFLIDDMCIFATKPPLMVYQANTTCKNENESDSLTHIVLRVDYQGFTEEIYSELDEEYYTVVEMTKDSVFSFLKLEDGYYNEDTKPAVLPSTVDTIYGRIDLPKRYYQPTHQDSIFPNLQDLIAEFERTLEEYDHDHTTPVFRKGYVFEHLDDSIRPVLYVVHSAKMSADNTYTVHMAGSYGQLLSSKCALTRSLKVRNRMILTLNGEEQSDKEVGGMCANTTYDLSLHVKGTLLLDSVAPIEVTGTCHNDWLLYGDTAAASSKTRYGYCYNDIVTVIKDILRADPSAGTAIYDNPNHLAHSLAEVDKAIMKRVQNENTITLSENVHPYDVLAHLVNGGFLTLYQSNLTVITPVDDSIKYTIFPIPGSGSEVMQDMNIDVCPTPVHIQLKSSPGQGVPLVIGGLNRSEEESQLPITVLVDAQHANSNISIPIDSLMMFPGKDGPKVVLKQINFLSTNDPDYREGVHTIALEPDRTWNLEGGENTDYYKNGNDTILIIPAAANNYTMREGYNYTFGIEMMTNTGSSDWGGSEGCPVGTVPFIISVVPEHLRWAPQSSENNKWNDADNWIGINQHNEPIHSDARFVPLSSCKVVIPQMQDGKPYPELPGTITSQDSVQKTGFEYNQCCDIRFLSGAAIGQQQRLNYENAIIDMSLPHKMWALRSAPITGMLSGDLYMANADITNTTPMWEVGEFDANGRNYQTGNASFWLSLFNHSVTHKGNGSSDKDTTYTADAKWSKVTNGMTLAFPPAQGWAIYTKTKSEKDAEVRLPKNDDMFYYYYQNGDKAYDHYESDIRSIRKESAGGKAGELAFYPGTTATSQSYTLTNGVASTYFVFGNPTMGFIDIWGFIADNPGLVAEISYIDNEGRYIPITQSAAEASAGTNVITNLQRYLPPMQAIVLTKETEALTLTITLNASRIVTKPVQRSVPSSAPAIRRANTAVLNKGIMTVTAINPVSSRCISRLLLGQGYHSDIIGGEDAILTTINIDNYTNNTTPATPFNIYAVEGNSGLCIDLRDEIVNVPISFYMSDLPYAPETQLWFMGVNNISGSLVLFDSLTLSERPIIDGICLKIETPASNHLTRYYIRRNGELPPEEPVNPVATDLETNEATIETPAIKIMRNGHVLILRNGHVYTIFGQKLQ